MCKVDPPLCGLKERRFGPLNGWAGCDTLNGENVESARQALSEREAAMEFHEKLQELRKQKGLTQVGQDMAQTTKITATTNMTKLIRRRTVLVCMGVSSLCRQYTQKTAAVQLWTAAVVFLWVKRRAGR